MAVISSLEIQLSQTLHIKSDKVPVRQLAPRYLTYRFFHYVRIENLNRINRGSVKLGINPKVMTTHYERRIKLQNYIMLHIS